MACSNNLEVLCTGSGYESVESHLEVAPSDQKLAVENTVRVAGNKDFRPYINTCEGPRVNHGGSF